MNPQLACKSEGQTIKLNVQRKNIGCNVKKNQVQILLLSFPVSLTMTNVFNLSKP